LAESCFTAGVSENQVKIRDSSALDLRGLNSRIKVQADDTVVAPARFSF